MRWMLHRARGISLQLCLSGKHFEKLSRLFLTATLKVPRELEPQPLSLLSALTSAGEYRNTLKHRVMLAYDLALSVYQLHVVKWVHKSLRSENVIFFPSSAAPSGTANKAAVPDALVTRGVQKQFGAPWLLGFEFSRGISGISELATTDTELAKNLYRHPERWNAPTLRFGPIHDIYALGTVLLEVGLWRALPTLSRDDFEPLGAAALSEDQETAGQAKEAIRDQLLLHARRQLPFTIGRTYSDVVRCCLIGTASTGPASAESSVEGLGLDENDHTALNRAFREKVINPLAQLSVIM